MACYDCTYGLAVHAYPVAGDGDWHTGLLWHSTYKQKTQNMKVQIERMKQEINHQKETIQHSNEENDELQRETVI
jgi:hypothetical protein